MIPKDYYWTCSNPAYVIRLGKGKAKFLRFINHRYVLKPDLLEVGRDLFHTLLRTLKFANKQSRRILYSKQQNEEEENQQKCAYCYWNIFFCWCCCTNTSSYISHLEWWDPIYLTVLNHFSIVLCIGIIILTSVGRSTLSFEVCRLNNMTAYSTNAPNTNKIQANIHASIAVKPESKKIRYSVALL